MPPIGRGAGIGRGLQICRIIRDRHQQRHDQDKRQSQPQHPAAEERRHPFALQARPHEQAGQEKEKGHQEDVLPGAEQFEPDPPVAVDDRKGAPRIRRAVERKRARRQKVEIGRAKSGTPAPARSHRPADCRAPGSRAPAAGADGWSLIAAIRARPAPRRRSARTACRSRRERRSCPSRRIGREPRLLGGAQSSESACRRGGPISTGWNSTAAPSCTAAPAPSARPCSTCRDRSTSTGCQRRWPWSSR